jgi:hypothetical protein
MNERDELKRRLEEVEIDMATWRVEWGKAGLVRERLSPIAEEAYKGKVIEHEPSTNGASRRD